MNAQHVVLRILAPALLGIGWALPISAASEALTPDEVVAAYANVGLVVSTPTFSADGVAFFSVDAVGQVGQPSTRVFVFQSAEAARSEHLQAHAREEAIRSRSIMYSDDGGPQLVSGYGLSLWRQNVALVQVAPADDVGAHVQEVECAPEVSISAPPLPRTAVAPIYRAPLELLIGGQAQATE